MKKITGLPWSHMSGISTNILDVSGMRVARCDFDGDCDSAAAIKNARDIIECVNSHSDLVSELIAAEKIILAMLNVLTPAQRNKITSKLEADGISADGATRYHERRAALAKAGVSA